MPFVVVFFRVDSWYAVLIHLGYNLALEQQTQLSQFRKKKRIKENDDLGALELTRNDGETLGAGPLVDVRHAFLLSVLSL